MDSALVSERHKRIDGCAAYSGSGNFSIYIINSGYSAVQIQKLLAEGELTYTIGDTELFDVDGEEIATVEWHTSTIRINSITFEDVGNTIL